MKIEKITKKLLKFRDDREWEKFHTPKNLAISLSIESAELLECFQWKTDIEVSEMMQTEERIEIEDEIADVASYLLLLCESLDIDVYDAINKKIEKNNQKYPVNKSKGIATKYSKL